VLLTGADIKFFRSNRLDVSVVQNHNIALCVVILAWRFFFFVFFSFFFFPFFFFSILLNSSQ